jgi:hypothetical protein
MTAWTDLVQKIYKEKSGKNASYKLKHAMKDAAKVYKKHSKTAKKIRGGKPCANEITVGDNEKCPEEIVAVDNTVDDTTADTTVAETVAPTEEKHKLPETPGGKRKTKKSKKDKKRRSARK